KHRHDPYAIGLTDSGVQVFDYRGSVHTSLPGDVVALYPDELHDGRAGAADGFGYCIVYVEPSRLADAVEAVRGRPYPLPFLREVVSRHPRLARAVRGAFRLPLEPLAADSLVVELAEGLLIAEGSRSGGAVHRRIDIAAVERARQFLESAGTRLAHSDDLERVSGLTRYDLARQFRMTLGTSPHRYQLMRRLERARDSIHAAKPLVEAASDGGFADQAHFTRAFRSAFGLTPGRYRALRRTETPLGEN
ncbi:MAG TPA: AraC family transcriptional regulator, partial [Usitatibacter sp.]|nr:AraC family transcriptional regulator [Usitatibacter sp.]